MNRKLKIILPLVVLALGIVGLIVLVKARTAVESRPAAVPAPLVRLLTVQRQNLQLRVRSQGSVTPRTESTLISQVSGRVIAVSPAFAAGGFFESGDLLVTIDPSDYELALVRAQAQVAQGRLRLAWEKEEADVARHEWELLGQGKAHPLVLRRPQLAQARADLAAAQAVLQQAQLDLERTEIRAPYAGRVRTKSVDVGQFVNRGAPSAKIYAVDYAEVRLPIPDDQLAFLDLPLDFRGDTAHRRGPEVILSSTFAGRQHSWTGHIVRLEGEIDPKSHMVHAVARVENPYGRGDEPQRPPLAVGLFVEAEIIGRLVEDVTVVPRGAMRSHNQILVVDDENRLHFRTVEVLRADKKEVVIRSGLTCQERVCLSPLDAVTDGMRVRTMSDESPIESIGDEPMGDEDASAVIRGVAR